MYCLLSHRLFHTDFSDHIHLTQVYKNDNLLLTSLSMKFAVCVVEFKRNISWENSVFLFRTSSHF
jgi:hypothetical protein